MSEQTLERLREKAESESTEEDSTETETTEPEKKAKTSLREYTILGPWTEIGKIEASSAGEALKKLGKKDGKYGVVPSRNFSVFTVTTETVTTTNLKPE